MCGKRLKMYFVLSVLFCLLLFSPSCFSCYAEVVLTDSEAEELMTEIHQSQKELTELKNELNNVKNTSIEQKKSYETQLTEAEKKNQNLETAVTITATTTAISIILCIIFAIL